METNKVQRVGLFIDCENISCKHLSDILNIASDFGELFIRYAYGNWITKNVDDKLEVQMQEWKKQCDDNGIITQSPIYTNKKNSSDIKMAIDILKITYMKNVLDVIVIVTSDSDFSAIANEVKLAGTMVVGIGIKEITNNQYTKYFNKFYYLDAEQKKEENINNKTNNKKEKNNNTNQQKNAKESNINILLEAQKKQLKSIVDTLIDESNEKVAFQSVIVDKMKKIYNDFTRKNLGKTNYETIINQNLPKEYSSKTLEDKTTIVWYKKDKQTKKTK